MVLGWVSESVEGWVERKYSGGIDVGDPVEFVWLGVVGDVDVEEEEDVEVVLDEEM